MCSLVSFIANHTSEQPDMLELRAAVQKNERKGPHAWGVIWRTPDGGIGAYKQPGRLTHSWATLERYTRGACDVFIHMRWATHGDPKDNRNNHPHPFGDDGWLIHNGRIELDCELEARYRLERATECDSELLGKVAADGRIGPRVKTGWRQGSSVARAIALAIKYSPSYPHQAVMACTRDEATIVRAGKPLSYRDEPEGTYFATDGGGGFVAWDSLANGGGYTVKQNAAGERIWGRWQMPKRYLGKGQDANMLF